MGWDSYSWANEEILVEQIFASLLSLVKSFCPNGHGLKQKLRGWRGMDLLNIWGYRILRNQIILLLSKSSTDTPIDMNEKVRADACVGAFPFAYFCPAMHRMHPFISLYFICYPMPREMVGLLFLCRKAIAWKSWSSSWLKEYVFPFFFPLDPQPDLITLHCHFVNCRMPGSVDDICWRDHGSSAEPCRGYMDSWTTLFRYFN